MYVCTYLHMCVDVYTHVCGRVYTRVYVCERMCVRQERIDVITK